MTARPWTDTEIETAKAFWSEGLSATEIARLLFAKFHIRRSRNAVIGRLHRSGCVRTDAQKLEVWSRRSAEASGFKAPRVKAPVIPKAKKGTYPRVKPETVVRARGLTAAEKQIVVRSSGGPIAYVESGAGVESPEARAFQDRVLGQCAWPLGERAALSCCNPVAGGEGFGANYCAGHLKALLAPVQPKAPGQLRQEGSAGRRDSVRSAWDGGRIAA